MYDIASQVYDELFPSEPRAVFESTDIGRIEGERIYTDCT